MTDNPEQLDPHGFNAMDEFFRPTETTPPTQAELAASYLYH
jgi:hypothetical protein